MARARVVAVAPEMEQIAVLLHNMLPVTIKLSIQQPNASCTLVLSRATMKGFDEPKMSFLGSFEDEDSTNEQNDESNACSGGTANDSRSLPITAAVVVVREFSGDRNVYLSASSVRGGLNAGGSKEGFLSPKLKIQ